MQRSLSPQPDDSTVDQRPQDRRVGDEKLAILRFDVGALDQLWYAKMPRRTGRARQMRGMLLRDEVRARPALPFEGGGVAGKRAFVIPILSRTVAMFSDITALSSPAGSCPRGA